MHEDGHVEGPVTDTDRCRIWFSEDLDNFVPDDDADTHALPDHCGTCFLPFGCGCPGDGWSVPVHVRLPDVMAGVSLATYDTTTRNVKSLFVADLSRPRRWFNRFTRGARDAGRECSPLVPFRNGAPIYLKPWGEP
jgi:hypothetical protein